MEKMRCENCGNELRENAKFCEKCGTRIETAEESNISQVLTESQTEDDEADEIAESEPVEENEPEKAGLILSYKKRLLIIIGVVALVLIIIFIASLAGGNIDSGGNTTASQTTAATKKVHSVQYIGARSVDFQEETNEFRVFFHLLDENEVEVDASGTASIKIVNDNGETVFNKDIGFTAQDFTVWTYKTKDEMPYMACLYIPIDDIALGTTENGTLTLEVKLSDGTSFDANNMTLYGHLPVSEATITLPSVPATYKEYNYKNEIKYIVEVQNIDYEVGDSYNGEQSITVNVTVEMQSGCQDTASPSQIGYSLTDSEGIVVDSGTIYNTPLFNGETTKTELVLYDLKVGENYNLKFGDAK